MDAWRCSLFAGDWAGSSLSIANRLQRSNLRSDRGNGMRISITSKGRTAIDPGYLLYGGGSARPRIGSFASRARIAAPVNAGAEVVRKACETSWFMLAGNGPKIRLPFSSV
jgi:hypothetical protein